MDHHLLFVMAVEGTAGIELYAKAAHTFEGAEKMALTTYNEEFPASDREPSIRRDLSFQLTCAPDETGKLLEIDLKAS